MSVFRGVLLVLFTSLVAVVSSGNVTNSSSEHHYNSTAPLTSLTNNTPSPAATSTPSTSPEIARNKTSPLANQTNLVQSNSSARLNNGNLLASNISARAQEIVNNDTDRIDVTNMNKVNPSDPLSVDNGIESVESNRTVRDFRIGTYCYSNGTCVTCNLDDACPAVIPISWWETPPYIYKGDKKTVEGIFPQVLKTLFEHCCGHCVNLSYSSTPLNDSEEVKKNVGANGSLVSLTMYGDMKEVRFQTYPFYPVVESPGVVFIVKKEDSSAAATAVMKAVFQGWPVLLLTLIMAALSGIIIWALDTYWNPEEFPRSFFKGTWEGFWWAFVSMTTVGYGDRAPRSVLARTFAFVWVLIGLVIISIFTATVTTSLTAISLSNDVKLYGSEVVALKNTEEQRLGVKSNAKVTEVGDVKMLKDSILTENTAITGALLDSYVAGYYADKDELKEEAILNDLKLRVGTVIDHQFAYGFVVHGSLTKEAFTKCLRQKLNRMETDITSIIQKKARTMEESGKSAAEEKTSNLFDANSPIFQKAIFTCLGLVAALTVCGLIWEFAYWRPRQPKEAKTEVERIVPPETTYEALISQQRAEIEESMMNEVQRFYIAWNKKLEELKTHNRQMSTSDVNVMGMGDSRGF